MLDILVLYQMMEKRDYHPNENVKYVVLVICFRFVIGDNLLFNILAIVLAVQGLSWIEIQVDWNLPNSTVWLTTSRRQDVDF